MIEVRVPDEIKDYKESIVAGLSIRQLVCGAIALGCGIPTFLLLKNFSNDLATYATMAVTVPAFCVGFIKKDGYTFEKYIKIRFKAMFGKSKRTYQTKGNLPPVEVEEYREELQKYLAEKQLEELKERKSKKKMGGVRVAKKCVSSNAKREAEIIEITTQSPERKRKAAFKAIKSTEKSRRKEEQKDKKEATS